MPTEISNLVNMVLKLGDWVNVIWNFHLVVSIAILGWIFSTKQIWDLKQKIIVTVVYIAFVWLNLEGQIQIHTVLDVSLNELKEAVGPLNFKTSQFKDALQNVSRESTLRIILVHLATDLSVMLCIWTKLLKRKSKSKD
jgi:hypothetical protein